METFLLALGLTLIAGLSTTIGNFIAILVKKPSSKKLRANLKVKF